MLERHVQCTERVNKCSYSHRLLHCLKLRRRHRNDPRHDPMNDQRCPDLHTIDHSR